MPVKKTVGRPISEHVRHSFDADYLKWIKTNLEKPGKTGSGLGLALGINKSGASHIVNGNRQLRLEWVPALAAYFECDIPAFARLGSVPHVRYGGILEVGVYRDFGEHPQSTTECIPDPSYPAEHQILFEVARSGLDGLNHHPIFDGDHVLCVDLAAFGGWSAVQTGAIVAVARAIDQDIVERSLRLVSREQDRLIFLSDSRTTTPKAFDAGELDPNVTIIGVARKLFCSL